MLWFSSDDNQETEEERLAELNAQSPAPVLSYSYLVQQFRELATIIQHDQKSMVTCAAILEQMSSRARRKISFEAHFYDDVPTQQPVSMLAGTPVHQNHQPVSMLGRSRFKSANEKRRKESAPTEYTGPPSKQPKRSATGGKRCRLCKQRQHQVQRCPLILPFSGRWLTQRQPHVGKAQRSALAANLLDPLVYTTGRRSSLKKCDVFTSLPKFEKDGALIIHRRVYDDMYNPQKRDPPSIIALNVLSSHKVV
jgi:hypothetical protein